MTKAKIAKEAAAIAEKIAELRDDLDSLKSEAEEYYNERSEKWQEGEAGTAYQEMIDNLDGAYGDIDSAISVLEDVGSN